MNHLSMLSNHRAHVLLLLAGLLLSTSVLAGPLKISEASWDARKHNDALYIKGTGEDNAPVYLYDAQSGEPVGQTSTDRRGRWQYQSNNPSNIPCRIRGVSKDVTVEQNVSNANAFPGGCGPGAVNTPPTASFTATPSSGVAPLTVSFDASGSTDADGSISSYAWTFGDGGTGNGVSPAHTYNSQGNFTARLTVTDNDGATNSTTRSIAVSAANQAPTASFTATPSSGVTPLTVSFNASASTDPDGSISSYAWDFGDGSSPGSGVSPSHTYNSQGNFTARLTVTDNDGATNSTTRSIAVSAANQAPTASFTATPASGVAPLTVSFNASASTDPDGSISSYAWDFGDGSSPGSGVSATHEYTTPGGYTARLTVTDNDGATNSTTRSISIQSSGGGGEGGPPKNAFNIMMNYELGMHCTGFEFSYCCVLPPYNSILAQVVKTEKGAGSFPQMLEADPSIVDGLGRPYVMRDPALDSNGKFKKYVLRYWHDAQPRDASEAGAEQSSTLISQVEGNSLMMWNTVFDAAAPVAGALQYGDFNGSLGVVQGNGSIADSNDNYWNAIWNHLYIYHDLEGSGGHPGGNAPEVGKVRLGVNVIYPESTGAALHPMGPGVTGGAGLGNLLTYSNDTGTVVYTQMKVLEDLPVTLTSPRIWEALGLPLTPFEDTIDFFTDPGAVDETSLRPYVAMKAQMHYYDSTRTDGIGEPVLDAGQPVIGMGTAPIDIPNCERCHALGDGVSINSAQNGNPYVDSLVQAEIEFWNAEYRIGAGDSDWYSRLKGAAISMLALHDQQHGTSFTLNYDPASTDGNPASRLGADTVICQRCHADNVIAVVKSANCGPGPDGDGQNCDADHPRNELWSNITGTTLIPPLTEAIHLNHQDTEFDDALGRNGGCQGCHPAHRSDGDMSNYPITELGLNAFAGSDNRDAAGGCYVGRDVHSNPFRNLEAQTPSHMNPVGQWLVDNVISDSGTDKGIWCTNCHTQLGQELWKAENVDSLVHAQPGDPGHVREPFAGATLADVAGGIGISLAQAEAWLDPKTTEDMVAVWQSDPGMCDHVSGLFGGPVSPFQDGGVATIEVNLNDGASCSTGAGAPGPDCGGTGPAFYICLKTGSGAGGLLDTDGDVNVNLLDFCTTPDCVAKAQAALTGPGQAAVPVPFSAATDGRDHWLSAGEPHCADCHAAPFVEQSGNINAFAPFNYPQKASLFRYSRGHQDITCQGCHESTHGMYPVTPPGYVAGSTKAVDQTTWEQAAGMNTDGSHGPLKCGACHDANDIGVWERADRITYDGIPIKDNFDAAVSWMHTFTDEADPREEFCRNCHSNKTNEMQEDDGRWKDGWMVHAMRGRVSRSTMDKVEIAEFGHVAGDPAFENPRTSACRGCHDDEWSGVSCTGGESTEWKRHLTEGRVSASVWEYVSIARTGSSCDWQASY